MAVAMQYGSGAGNAFPYSLFAPELVWENPDPDSSFASQTLALPLGKYVMVIIEYSAIGAETIDVAWGFVDSATVLKCFSVNTNNRNGRRQATISSTGIVFSACQYNGGTSNGYCIPLRIFGVKGTTRSGSGEGSSVDIYTGAYTVVPEAYNDQTLATRNKQMVDDVTVTEIPTYETSNPSGGTTFYIGTEVT